MLQAVGALFILTFLLGVFWLRIGRNLSLLTLGFVLFFSGVTAWAEPATQFQFFNLHSKPVPLSECATLLKTEAALKTAESPRKLIRLQDRPQIIVTQWNVENVMEYRGKHEYSGVDRNSRKYKHKKARDHDRHMQDWKFAAKQQKINKVGQYWGLPDSELSDFVFAQEIENLNMANKLFNTGVLEGKYRTFLVEGNDGRGIDVALAVRSNLAVDVEIFTHREVEWYDPIERTRARLFSRDLPVAIIKDSRTQKILMIMFGNHAKSKRHREGPGGFDHESTILRTAQYEAATILAQGYERRFGPDTPILFAGDFNTSVSTGPEMALVKSLFRDAFDIVGLENRVTQSYFPSKGKAVHQQLDGIMMTRAAERHLRSAMILPEFDRHTGVELGLPQSYEDRTNNYPSDHRAISVLFDAALFRGT